MAHLDELAGPIQKEAASPDPKKRSVFVPPVGRCQLRVNLAMIVSALADRRCGQTGLDAAPDSPPSPARLPA